MRTLTAATAITATLMLWLATQDRPSALILTAMVAAVLPLIFVLTALDVRCGEAGQVLRTVPRFQRPADV